MVEVFKTNVAQIEHATTLEGKLSLLFPASNINFDLGDCDKVLRVEGEKITSKRVIELLKSNGYDCQILEY